MAAIASYVPAWGFRRVRESHVGPSGPENDMPVVYLPIYWASGRD